MAGYSDRTLLETFTQTSPNIDCLAIVVPELPHAVDIEKLALICPKLRELTLCAHLMSGTWKWPDTLHDYAVAFSKLPCLEKLALNHDDAAVDLDNPDESHLFGKFSINCTQESAALRLDFCRHLANSCLSLTDIAFCPFEQKQSCIRVERIEDTVAEVGFTDNCGKFCWEAF